PVKTDAETQAPIAMKQIRAQFLVAPGGVLPAVVVAMDEKRDVRLLFVLAGLNERKTVRGGDEQPLEVCFRTLPPIPECGERTVIAGPISKRSAGSAESVLLDDAVRNHPIFWHGDGVAGFSRKRKLKATVGILRLPCRSRHGDYANADIAARDSYRSR